MTVGFWIRLHDITLFGIGGSDPVLYFTLAEHWVSGDFTYQIGSSITVFRPVYLAFSATALWLFGHADYSIKLANALVDCANILLVAALAWSTTRRLFITLLVTITYSMLPTALYASRVELPHVLSTLLYLSGTLCLFRVFLNMDNFRRVRYGAMSGLLFAMASLTHEELIFILAVSTLFLLLSAHFQQKMKPRATCLLLASHTLFPFIAAALIILNEWSMVVQSSSLGRELSLEGIDFLRFPRFVWEASSAIFSPLFTILYLIALTLHTLPIGKEPPAEDRSMNIMLSFCLWMPIIYLAIYSMLLNTLFVRGLLPLTPFMAIGVFGLYARVLPQRTWEKVGLSVATILLCITCLAAFRFEKVAGGLASKNWSDIHWPNRNNVVRGSLDVRLHANVSPNNYRNYWRNIHERLRDIVDEDNRVLIVPSVVLHAPGRRALQTKTYLGDNAIYRIDHHEESLSSLITHKRIRYIMWAQGQLKEAPGTLARYRYDGNWAAPERIDLAKSFALQNYTMEAESMQVTQALIDFNATELSLFPKNTYQGNYTRIWQLNY